MSKNYLKYILRFIVLVFLQVFILENIQISGYINPYLYIAFILTLPFNTPKWLLLVMGFVLGFVIDAFSKTYGLHTAATVFLAFCRPGIISLISSQQDLDQPEVEPSVKDFGFRWFFTYALMLTLLHHFFLFYVEAFRWSEFFQTFGRVVFSTIFTVLLILIAQYFIFKKK